MADLSGIDPTNAATWPTHCPTCGTALTRTRQCLGHGWVKDADGNKTGEKFHCTQYALRGQTKCKMHGGATKIGKAKGAQRLQAAQLDRDLGALLEDLEVSAAGRGPTDVLLDQVHRCSAMVAVLGAAVGRLDGTSSGGSSLYGPNHQGDGAPHVLTTMYERWIGLAGKSAKLALDAGIEERLVSLAEGQGRLIADVLRAVLDDPELGLTAAQRAVAGPVARRHLEALDGGAA